MVRKLAVVACCVLVTVAVASDARADTAAAQELFDKALALLKDDNWDEACRKFRASMELDPSVGTLLHIARCHEHEGKLGSALSDYEKALVLNRETPGKKRRADLAEYTRKEIERLKPRVPRLKVTVDRKVPGLEIHRGIKPLPLSALGEALPGDAGPIEVVAVAPGYRASATATLVDGETVTVELVLKAVPQSATPPLPNGRDQDSGGVPTWAWVTGGIGLAVGVVGVVFAVDYANTVSELEDNCGGNLDPCTPPQGSSYTPDADNSRKNRDAALGISFGVVGGVALTAAIIGAIVGSTTDSANGSTSTSWRLAPAPLRHGAGAVLWGQF